MTKRIYIYRGRQWPRRERRRITLREAKRQAKANGFKRRTMHLLWADLMQKFPKGISGLEENVIDD